MFERLMKLANELDTLGLFKEADEVDELIRAMAADEIEPDIDEAPIDLTEEESVSTPSAVVTPPPEDPEAAAMRAELEKLRQENQQLKFTKMRKQPSGGIKVSPKGAVSVYGLGQWPVTLYQSQWVKLLGMKDQILKFITDNAQMLKTKEEKK